MPIKGLSDRPRNFQRVGKIRLGKKSEKGFPTALRYFRVEADNTTSQQAADAFHVRYGETPTQLTVRFPTDNIEQWADPNYKMYTQSWMLTCKGDGEAAMAKWDMNQDGPRPEGIEEGTWANTNSKAWIWRAIPCPAEACPMQVAGHCKMKMNLQFVLDGVPGLGVWQIDTGSYNSVHNLQNGIDFIKQITGGRVRGLPMTLSLVAKEVTPPGVKKKTVRVLDINMLDESIESLLRETHRLEEAKGLLYLPPGIIDDEEEELPDDEDDDEDVIEGEATEPTPLSVTAVVAPDRPALPGTHGIPPPAPRRETPPPRQAPQRQRTRNDPAPAPPTTRGEQAEERSVAPPAPAPPAKAVPTFANRGEFMTWAWNNWKISSGQICEIVGVSDSTLINDLQAAAEKVLQSRRALGEAVDETPFQ